MRAAKTPKVDRPKRKEEEKKKKEIDLEGLMSAFQAAAYLTYHLGIRTCLPKAQSHESANKHLPFPYFSQQPSPHSNIPCLSPVFASVSPEYQGSAKSLSNQVLLHAQRSILWYLSLERDGAKTPRNEHTH